MAKSKYKRSKRMQKRDSPADVLVRVRNLEFSYHREQSAPLFQGVNLNFRKGEVVAILGASGSGKTTLLRLLSGQLAATDGSIEIDGIEIADIERKDLYSLRRRMGMLFQSGALLTDMSVFENVAFPIREHAELPETMLQDIVLMKLEAVGLRGARDLMPSELSGGMARRVALARAIALDPMLVLYDEPFTGQDPISMAILMKLVRRINRVLQATSIIVSHDVDETLSIADYVYLLADGMVVAQGSPQQIREESSPWVRQFIRGEADGPAPFHYPAQPILEELL